MPIPVLDGRGVTPELKLRLEFYCSWTCWYFFLFFFFVVCLFVILLWVFLFLFLYLFSFFVSILSTSPSLSSYPYSHPLHSPSPVLQSIALLPDYSFFLFILSPCIHLPFLSSLTCHQTTPPSYTHADQLYTTPNPCNPWHKNPTLQQRKYTQTHTRATNPAGPTLLPPLIHQTSCLPF
jgi:hypothetical protein